MSKSILILNGSPREKGNTTVLANQLTAGAEEKGALVESFFLDSMNIRPCDACDFCQENEDGCVIADDMQKIYPKLRAADVIVLATPVYWFNLTAQLKACIDRFYALDNSSGMELAGKQLSLMLVYGDTDLHSSGGINVIHSLEYMSRYIGLKFDNIVHGTADEIGDAEKNTALMEEAFKLGQKLAVVE